MVRHNLLKTQGHCKEGHVRKEPSSHTGYANAVTKMQKPHSALRRSTSYLLNSDLRKS